MRNRCERSTQNGRRFGTWSGIAHRVPPITLQAGLRARAWNFFQETAPSHAYAQWYVAVPSDTLTVAGAAPA
jgi:hypothetical protein